MQSEWKATKARHVTGESLYIGSLPAAVASWHYDGVTNNAKKCTATFMLPGMGKWEIRKDSAEEIRPEIEAAVTMWFERTNAIQPVGLTHQ